MKCDFSWEGYRVLKDLDTGEVEKFIDKSLSGGMTECPKYLHIYVEWVNAREILKKLGRYWEE